MTTVADRVRVLEAQLGAEFRRTPRADTIRAELHCEDGTVLCAYGPTTADAVTALEHKVTRFVAAMTEEPAP